MVSKYFKKIRPALTIGSIRFVLIFSLLISSLFLFEHKIFQSTNTAYLNPSFTSRLLSLFNSNSACSGSGTILREMWTNISGNSIASIPLNNPPNNTSQLSKFEGPTDLADNYGSRIRGYICVPVTGNYLFWISSNNTSELWLSNNDSPSNKIKIASVPDWTNVREWTKYASQKSQAAYLVAGQKYYIEALHKESTLGDHIAVGWQMPDGSLERPIPGNRLSPYVSSNVSVNITSPANNATFTENANINITANASAGSGSIVKVEFFRDNIKLGEDLTTPYSFSWNNVPAGSYSLNARASNSTGVIGTSQTVSISVNPASGSLCTSSGTILIEVWTNISGNLISSIPVNTTPNSKTSLTIFESPKDVGDNYGCRIRGYVCPPNTGNYYFWIASNNTSELWLSSDDSPANIQKIAAVNDWTNSREWTKYAAQKSNAIYLVAGKRYYVEVLHKESTQGDHLAVGWQLPNGTLERPIPGARLSPSTSTTPIQYPKLSRGPYLQLSTSNSLYVRWRTDLATISKVRYGTLSGSYSFTLVDSSKVTEHIVKLTGLNTYTKYYYTIESDKGKLQGDSLNYFYTNPATGSSIPVRIWAFGDAGTGLVYQNQVRDSYYNFTKNRYTNVWLLLGDNAYDAGTDNDYQQKVFTNHYEQMLKKTAVWPVLGNHDNLNSNSVNQTGPYFNIFTLPKNAEAGGVPSGTESYYSFNYANIHFIALESAHASFRAIGSSMYNWLKSDLESNTQKWTVVYFHASPYSKGSHDSDVEIELVERRQNIIPLIEQHRVDLVLCGHSHNYERSFLIYGHYGKESTFSNSMKINSGSGIPPNYYYKTAPDYRGTVYNNCGVAGSIHSTSSGWPHNAMYYSSSSYHGSIVIDINGDTLKQRFLTSSGTIADQFNIIKQDNFNAQRFANSSVTKDVITDNTSVGMRVFPNPAGESFNLEINCESTQQQALITMYNLSGEQVLNFERTIENGRLLENIAKENLPDGIYLINVKIADSSFVQKILIE